MERVRLLRLLPAIVLAVFASVAASAPVQSVCGSGGVSFPPGNPWASSRTCSGSCADGACALAVVPTGVPGVYQAFCSCDGMTQPECCHLVATAVSGPPSSLDFDATGSCRGECPGAGGSTCKKVPIIALVDGVPVLIGYAPICS